ncbi:APC family permease [Candidatus Dependentiae bacterium]|nr:APC family permease [Candidatus Dependentiae bacterium]
MDQTHKISFWTAVLMNINIMVGIGIFILPPLMTQRAGYASFLGWPLVALVVLPIVLSVAAMARLFPGAGSFYSYAKNIIGPNAGFFSGWGYYLGYTGVGAFMTIALRDDVILPHFPMNPVLFNLLFITTISLLSLLNIKTIGRIQNAGTIFKILPLLIVLAVFIAYWNPAFHITLPSLGNVPSVVPFALFGYWGFEVCCTISHLIEGDKNSASRAILLAFGIIMVLYSLFHFGILHIMGAKNLAAAGSAKDFVYFLGLSPYAQALFSTFITVTIAFVFINAVFSIFTAVSSTLQAMAHENILPYSQALIKQSKQHRPWVAIIIQGILTFIITCTTSNKSIFIAVINLGILTAFFLTLIALFKLQRRMGQTKQIGMTILAFISLGYFTHASWMDKGLGATHLMKFVSTLPLLAGFAIGYAMYQYKKRTAATGQ